MTQDHHSATPAVFHWRLESEPLPAVARALIFGRAARNALMAAMNGFGIERLPDGLHHAGPEGDSAFWLPLDEDDDGLIDHFCCIHPPGLPGELLPAFAAGGRAALGPAPGRRDGGGAWRLRPVWMGPLLPGSLLGPARLWTSVTPYVTPRETRRTPDGPMRPGRALEDQVRRDCVQKSLPAPFGIAVASHRPTAHGEMLAAMDFELTGLGHKPPPRDAEAAFVDLAFREPVSGPLALGHGAHSGLGLFRPTV